MTSFTFDLHMLGQERVKATPNSDDLASHASRIRENLNAFELEMQGHDEETQRGTLGGRSRAVEGSG